MTSRVHVQVDVKVDIAKSLWALAFILLLFI